MRLKYQLRGLGIGIILTAALLMISSNDGEAAVKTDDTVAMADAGAEAEIQESVMQAESTIPLQEDESIQEENSIAVMEKASDEEESSQEEETEVISREEQSVIETTEEGFIEESKESETLPETALEESEESADNAADVVRIKIVSGDDSGTVARKLQTAGLVDNAGEFDAYLMQHGYDKKIAVGEKEIPRNATWLEIAGKISER